MAVEESKAFKKAQWRFIACSMVAYAFFYITRKNLSMAQPLMIDEGVVTKMALGTIMTVHGVLYGLSRFVNGFLRGREGIPAVGEKRKKGKYPSVVR